MAAVIESWFRQDLQKPVQVHYLDGSLFSNNGNGNRIGVELTNGGEDYTVTGTVSGYAVLADGSTVPCTGAKSGNKASILVPPAAYLPGNIFITIFLTDGTTVTTLAAVSSTVIQARTDNQVNPGSVVTDWTNTINAAMQSVETAAANLGQVVATPYAQLTFPVPFGKYTYYNNNLYRCITPIASSEDFTAAHWSSALNLGDEVSDLKSAIGEYYSVLNGSYVSKKWKNTGYSFFYEVDPGSEYSVVGNVPNGASFYGLKSVNFPLVVDSSADLSDADGWTSARTVESGAQDTGVIPSDVHYLYIYLGANANQTKRPNNVIVNGIDILGTICDNTIKLRDKIEQNKDNIAQNQTDISENRITSDILLYGHPYGFQAFQMSIFKPLVNLFSEFCNYISKSYYGTTGTAGVGKNLEIKTTNNWKGWLIRVKPNTTYSIGPCDYAIVFFNARLVSDKVYLVSELSDTQPTTITSGNDSYWMALTERIGRDMSQWMMVEGDTYPSEYVSGYPQWVNTPKSVTDKTIAFFGDSITAGSGWTGEPDSQGYHQYIHDLYGFTCLNYGYGGSGYVTNYDGTGGVRGTGQPGKGVANTSGAFTPNNVRTRLAEVTPSDLDGVVIFAGTNDWSHQVPLADFATELDTVYDYYQTNFGDVPLLIMTPIHRLNDADPSVHSIPLIDYVNTIIQKCREHGIPYIDTFTMSGLQPNNSGNSAVFFPRDDNQNHTIDGIHPNHLAHQRLARCIGETLNQMILWNETAIR